MNGKVWTFDDFEPGRAIGSAALSLDRERLARWQRLFAAAGAGADAPPGLLVALLMEGYMAALAPRPPGNIHAGQTLRFSGHPLCEGEAFEVAIGCNAKQIKRERRWVHFGATMCNEAGTEILAGEMRVIWAA
ncbi:hypothetical protein BH23PSE1_BH23PSE1_02080 [soil metagenome]